MMREAPVFAAFNRIEVIPLKQKSYMLHVFVIPKEELDIWMPTRSFLLAPEAWPEEKNYAGCGAIFGGKAGECKNCLDRQPFSVLVEVQQTLSRLKLSRHNAGFRVLCEDEDGTVCTLEETPVPQPVLVGPMFEDPQASHTSTGADWATGLADGEVAQLQNMLFALGYKPGAVDGKFGPMTEAAVLGFQTFAGLKGDGIAGPETKRQMLKPRKDVMPDSEPADLKVTGPASRFTKESVVRFSVGPAPGYLDTDALLTEVDSAFSQWSSAMGLQFSWTGSALKSDIHVCFEDLTMNGEDIAGGVAAAGGQLAEANAHTLKLDAAERWLLKGQEESPQPDSPKLFTYTQCCCMR